jgi:transcriptional regulator with XRE-family HTH domain
VKSERALSGRNPIGGHPSVGGRTGQETNLKVSPAGPATKSDDGPVINLGARLREVRLAAGLSLREVSRQLGISPSFVSQMENGKSQPSVATLYSFAQLLGVTIDDLFGQGWPLQPAALVVSIDPLHSAISRSDFSSPADAWSEHDAGHRLSIVRHADRSRLVMDTGVVWEQLAQNTDHNLDFIEINYPVGSSSTTDGRMLRHDGFEYGYLLSGQLEITFGFEKATLHEGESVGMNSAVPHLLTNTGRKTARGIWVVHHCAFAH